MSNFRNVRPAQLREGFALPLAIMVLAILAVGLVAGFTAVTSEAATVSSQRAQAKAFGAAQLGLEQFLTRRKEVSSAGVKFCPHCWAVNAKDPTNATISATLDTLPLVRETVFVAFPGGNAIVRATPVFLNTLTGTGTYYITSTGTDSSSVVFTKGGSRRYATRTVGVFVSWTEATINVLGAWTSLGGIRKNGTGQINGIDQCGSGTNVAGIFVPSEAGVEINGGFVPTGTPPYDTLSTLAQAKASMKINWAAIRDSNAISADITIPGGTFPSTAQFAADTAYWPIIHVKNGVAPGTNTVYPLPNAGRGMLIIDGELSISGSNQWSGVILVGGRLTSNGNNVSEGATLSGLDYLISGSPASAGSTLSTADDPSVGNGQKSYVYNSCSVASATSKLARYTLMSNTWMDNVATY